MKLPTTSYQEELLAIIYGIAAILAELAGHYIVAGLLLAYAILGMFLSMWVAWKEIKRERENP